MNLFDFSFCGAALTALPSGALWWRDTGLLCVSDLHLGKSERMARRGGQALPPYETRDTLDRLQGDLDATTPRTVICLGDSFDDLTAAASLSQEDSLRIIRMQAGRRWVWIEGNHDPGPVDYGGEHRNRFTSGPLTFRHVATPDGTAEVSGHYHPKARLQTRGGMISRPAFLYDATRLILPAYGTYTGGLRSDARVLDQLMQPGALAILTGPVPTCVPMPR
ncbi:MAG: ligase-associated DNA damage response endonuclease PdeM [Roseobacter sp.]|jgi:DNA ligase-associated metallophosphoesterase|nr:ligase-associated DNA damage response endonuclease PdeM [Roseobacter sp.]